MHHLVSLFRETLRAHRLDGRIDGEPQAPLEELLEEVPLAPRRPELELGIVVGFETKLYGLRVDGAADRAHERGLRSVEAVGDAQDRGELGDLLLRFFRGVRELRMALLRRPFPVVAGDERDDVDLFLGEASHVVRRDEVVRVPVVAVSRDVEADVVQDGRVLEKEAVGVGEAVKLAGLVEDREGEPRDVMRVGLGVVAASRELHHAAPSLIGELVDELDAGTILGDVVGDDALAERGLAERRVIRARELEDRAQQHRARDDRIGAPRVEPGELRSIGVRERQELPLHFEKGAKGEHARRAAAARAVARARREAREREGRPGGERHEIEAHRAHAGDGRFERASHAVAERGHLARARRVGRLPFVAQPEDPELERNGEVALARVGQNELGRSAADVEERDAAAREIERVARAEVNEVRFFRAADDADVDAELVAHGAHEFAAVLRFAHRACGNGDERVGLMTIGDALERSKRVEPAPKDVGRDHPVFQRFAESHHFFGAIEDLHASAGIDVRYDEVKRVRSDVERGDSHLFLSAVTCTASPPGRPRPILL